MSSHDELLFYGEPREIHHYVDQATKIDYSTYDQESPNSVAASQSPRRIRHPRKDEIWDLSLDNAIQTSLSNAEIIRDNAQFLSSGNRLLAAPDVASSIYDVAIQESNVLFGQGGVAAALADFDAVMSTQMNWGKNEFPTESNTIGFPALAGQSEETAQFSTSIQKPFANGGLISLEHNINYSEVNQQSNLASSRPFNSLFTGNPGVGATYRQPLLQGAGAEYTRIAGTIVRRPTLQGIPTVNQGVVIARIRSDIALTDFESAVNNMVKDVEDTYWDLYLSYRRYDSEMVSRQSALQTWRQVRVNNQAERVGAADEAQARDNYYEIRARSEEALGILYNAELRLRRLLGLPVNDGKVIRPSTEPMTAEVALDWNTTLAAALVHRPELRRQKWNIKSLELQHTAAAKLVRPRLDFVASYAVNAFGDQLTGDGPNFHSAYATLLSGDHTNWGLGFEFSMPFGFRAAVTQVQNYEHRLAKARAILAQQELEISHELANSLQQIDQTYQTAKTNFNRRRAAERRVQAFEAEFRVQRTTLDLVLRAQISLAAAETAYYSSLVSYNRALNDLKYRKGTILTENSIFLTEGVWQEEAYDDALRRAWERSFAIDVSGWMDETEPEEFVFGCPTCHPTDVGAEPMPEDLEAELPYENPPPPLEGLEPDAVPEATSPPAGRAAQRSDAAEAGGLGTDLVPPYEETVPVDSQPTLLVPDSPTTVPLVPEPGPASPIETPIPEIQLKPVEFRQQAPAAVPDLGLTEPEKSPAPAVNHQSPQPVSGNAARLSPSTAVDTTPIRENSIPLPVPTDGGLSDQGTLSPTLPPDPFGEPQSSAELPSGQQSPDSVSARSRRELLQTAPTPVQNGKPKVFSTPIDITDGDDFPSPLKPLNQARANGGSRPKAVADGSAPVLQTAGGRPASRHFNIPAPDQMPRKKPALPSWGRFFKRAD